MLDVHPPEHRIGSYKDFLLHLFTITCGLLIALGLEAMVEAFHHHHQRVEAETNIRQEIEDNRTRITKAETGIHEETAHLIAVLAFLQAARAGHLGDASHLSLAFSEGPLRDGAWRTASATGVLDFVPYDTVELFSVAYKEQEQYEAMERTSLDDFLQLQSLVAGGFDPAKMTVADIDGAIPLVRRTIGHLAGLDALAQGTLASYAEALQPRER
jgi:hypothetical protein